jgi:D-alanyl-D-alanine carboxypeptidase
MEASTGITLYEKNVHERLYPASITKIMTVLVALENSSMDEQVTFSYDAVHSVGRGDSHIARDVGEVMTMEQCLYAIMLASANECANAVAEHVGGTIEEFVNMMNQKAQELGCLNTNFNNPNGLPDENHFTSAYDMALISKAALQNEDFRTITGTGRYTIPFTNKHPDEETFLFNHHRMLYPYNGDASRLYPGCIGGKTGFTQASLATLVTFAERDGMTLICVVMKTDAAGQYVDTKNLFDYVFDNFQLLNLAEQEQQFGMEGVPNTEIFGESPNIVKFTGQVILPKSASLEDVSSQNAQHGDALVSLEYTYAGHVVGRADIEIVETAMASFPFGGTGASELPTDIKPVINIRLELVLAAVVALFLIAGLVFGLPYLKRQFHFSPRSGGSRRKKEMQRYYKKRKGRW